MYNEPLDLLKLLGHDVRWKLVQALAVSDLRVQEMVDQVDEPMNLVSYHLKLLREAGLVSDHRSAADGRDVYYTLKLELIKQGLYEVGESIHPSIAHGDEEIAFINKEDQADDPVRVLFLCTHNSARSQMSEALLRHLSKGKIEVFSAGTEATQIKPLAAATMEAMHVDMTGQYSKTLDQYLDEPFDYVITVCDRAREVCPVFPGAGTQLHWSIPDPSDVEDEKKRMRAFESTARELWTRLHNLMIIIDRKQSGSL